MPQGNRIPVNVYLLAACQSLSVSCTLTLGLLGGIVGTAIAPGPSLATLPISCGIVGTAITTIPAAMLMQRLGRRRAFTIGAMIAATSGMLAAAAIAVANFWLFCVAGFGIGAHMAFAQHYRFAAAESVIPVRVSQAISIVLLGTLLAALLAPRAATQSADWIEASRYSASFLLVSLFALGAAVLLQLAAPPPLASDTARDAARPLREILAQPGFIVAVVSAAVGYGVMSFIMTATPISMHVLDGHSLHDTAWVIQSHVVAMYLPSFFSGALIRRFGTHRMMLAGIAANLACIGLGLAGRGIHDYWGALVMLGVGWNLLFVAGTTLLTGCYSPGERFKAQAANDFAVFTSSAAGSFAAGIVLHRWGWSGIQLAAAPGLILILAALLLIRTGGGPDRGSPVTRQ
jgi:predicted MFS family arabinose efflux permease